jgi:hypothetical protein
MWVIYDNDQKDSSTKQSNILISSKITLRSALVIASCNLLAHFFHPLMLPHVAISSENVRQAEKIGGKKFLPDYQNNASGMAVHLSK